MELALFVGCIVMALWALERAYRRHQYRSKLEELYAEALYFRLRATRMEMMGGIIEVIGHIQAVTVAELPLGTPGRTGLVKQHQRELVLLKASAERLDPKAFDVAAHPEAYRDALNEYITVIGVAIAAMDRVVADDRTEANALIAEARGRMDRMLYLIGEEEQRPASS